MTMHYKQRHLELPDVVHEGDGGGYRPSVSSRSEDNNRTYSPLRPRPIDSFHCLHPQCKRRFSEEEELRAHLGVYCPGIIAENAFLTVAVRHLSACLDNLTFSDPQIKAKVEILLSLYFAYVLNSMVRTS